MSLPRGVAGSLLSGLLVAGTVCWSALRRAYHSRSSSTTGRALRFTSCDIFRVQDGLIVEHWGMGDLAGVAAQLKA